jgi:hypothetical protein
MERVASILQVHRHHPVSNLPPPEVYGDLVVLPTRPLWVSSMKVWGPLMAKKTATTLMEELGLPSISRPFSSIAVLTKKPGRC